MSELDLVDRWIESLQILAGDADNPTAEQHTAMAVTRRRMLDTYAHGLAEKIRADIITELDEYGTREQQAEIDGRRGAADLIDPQASAGPVRPGEETTT